MRISKCDQCGKVCDGLLISKQFGYMSLELCKVCKRDLIEIIKDWRNKRFDESGST
jgi:formylmethanofuran dehydrogenase subunit B